MSFKNLRFPTTISYGAAGGPGFNTDVVELDSGHEHRNQNWSAGRRSYDVGQAMKTDQMRKDLLAFILIVKGKTYSFRFKDFTDFEVGSGEGVLSSLGSGRYQLYKRYTLSAVDVSSPSATETSDRLISLPLSAAITRASVALTRGLDYTLNEFTGIITMIGSPTPAAPDAWTGQFDVPVRFDTDSIRLVKEDISVFRTQSIALMEVRPEELA